MGQVSEFANRRQRQIQFGPVPGVSKPNRLQAVHTARLPPDHHAGVAVHVEDVRADGKISDDAVRRHDEAEAAEIQTNGHVADEAPIIETKQASRLIRELESAWESVDDEA